MTIQTLRVTCGKCAHVFDADMVADAALPLVLASMKWIRCPKCGSKEFSMGGNYSDAPPLTAPIEERVRWWRDRGEIGSSGSTIFHAFTGEVSARSQFFHFYWPIDPDDFRRCKQLLDLIPEWRAELHKVSDRFPWFAPFVSRWPEFERLYEEEVPTGSCPKLYDLMQVAGAEADSIYTAQRRTEDL